MENEISKTKLISLSKKDFNYVSEDLISKKQDALSSLISTLSLKQFKLLKKYLTIEKKYNKEKEINLYLFLFNKLKEK